jgi:tetratricopeptide (TPR) repeat protein
VKRTTNKALCGFVGIIVGLIVGFVLANSFNRSYSNSAAVSVSNLSTPASDANSTADEDVLTEAEIRRAVQNADARAEDGRVQLEVGMALYQYAKSRQDVGYLNDLERILKRAEKHNSDNFELLTALGEIEFVRGQETKQTQFYRNAETYFQKALKLKPDNVEALINLAAAFLFAPQPEPARAFPYIEKSLEIEPRNELANIYSFNALILENRLEDAGRRIEILHQINPQNPVLQDLRAQLAQKKQIRSSNQK